LKRGRIPGVGKDVSRIVMGTVRVLPEVWEAFLEGGGTCFDTARHYGDASEGELGAFLERHGLRDGLVIVGKGAHTPSCAPEHVAPELERSLELLRTDHLDLYLLHRDNPAVPVEEWADALAPHVAAGRMRAIGVSNWSAARFEAFNAAAARGGLPGLVVLSNQLSLAEMLEPVWGGCLRADTGWHEQTETPLLAWSAQARGFFAGRPDDDGEVRRCWLSRANAERRRRAERLARERGVPTVAVALAWVLAQPFPSFAVVGPRNETELAACLVGADVELTDSEIVWLSRPSASG
jgi:aryl-alcohol dehydrogenase-like predicted oxidoreductase